MTRQAVNLRQVLPADLPPIGTRVTAYRTAGTVVDHRDVHVVTERGETHRVSAGVVVEWPVHGEGWRSTEHPDHVRVAP